MNADITRYVMPSVTKLMYGNNLLFVEACECVMRSVSKDLAENEAYCKIVDDVWDKSTLSRTYPHYFGQHII